MDIDRCRKRRRLGVIIGLSNTTLFFLFKSSLLYVTSLCLVIINPFFSLLSSYNLGFQSISYSLIFGFHFCIIPLYNSSSFLSIISPLFTSSSFLSLYLPLTHPSLLFNSSLINLFIPPFIPMA